MRTADFHFDLPSELIAQRPTQARDDSRLMLMNRADGSLTNQLFKELPGFLHAGDVLVLNDSKVIPARLRGVNAKTGAEFELLLIEENFINDWWAMLRPGKRARIGAQICFRNRAGGTTDIHATVVEVNDAGQRRLQFEGGGNIREHLGRIGEMPIPPYIKRDPATDLKEDFERYQTVYANVDGSVAAPTAGLHFTPSLLDRIRGIGVQICFVTLHVGPGTFAPLKVESIADHVMHEEQFKISEETARTVNTAKVNGRRVIGVGTTSLRVLESVASQNGGRIQPCEGRTRIFIHPPFRFRVIDALLTNFHLPCSTLLMLVSAFAAPEATRGRDLVLHAYAEAIRERYRFFSYGDAMLVV